MRKNGTPVYRTDLPWSHPERVAMRRYKFGVVAILIPIVTALIIFVGKGLGY